MAPPAPAASANDSLPVEKKEWFERLPWTTIFVCIVFLIKDKNFFVYSLKGDLSYMNASLLSVGIDTALLASPRHLLQHALFDSQNYHTYTLTSVHLKTSCVGSVLLLLGVMFLVWCVYGEKRWKNAYAENAAEDAKLRTAARKRFSWTLSTFNSGLLSLVGALYMQEHIHVLQNPLNLVTWPMQATEETWYSQSNIGTITMIYFAIFNVMELIFGVVFFKEHLDPLTALVHHPVFSFIMTTGVTGNMFSVLIPIRDFILVPVCGGLSGGDFLIDFISNTLLPLGQVKPWNTIFVVLCLEELPTFLLGLGTLFPSFRTDLGFGLTFFFFRLLVHVWFMVWMPLGFPFLCYCQSLVLHVFWFKGWVLKYGPCALGLGGKGKGGGKGKVD